MKSFTEKEKNILAEYIPKNALPIVEDLFVQYGVFLKIVNGRKTKHGDFRALPNGKTQITVNRTLNKSQFLLTLIHEIAHHVTFQNFRGVKPHGKEWKNTFQKLMRPFLIVDAFPKEVLPCLENYMKNPKASTDSDAKLSLALRGFEAKEGYYFVSELPIGTIFIFRNQKYKRGNKRRTRYECTNLSNGKLYAFNPNTEVKIDD